MVVWLIVHLTAAGKSLLLIPSTTLYHRACKRSKFSVWFPWNEYHKKNPIKVFLQSLSQHIIIGELLYKPILPYFHGLPFIKSFFFSLIVTLSFPPTPTPHIKFFLFFSSLKKRKRKPGIWLWFCRIFTKWILWTLLEWCHWLFSLCVL